MKSARVFTFGYDAEFVFSKGTGTLKDNARSLLQRITAIRETPEATVFSTVTLKLCNG